MTSSSLGILDILPPEVIVDILKRVDWRTVLWVRQTCKGFLGITYSKTIWVELFWRCRSESSPQIIRLERPIDVSSSTEIEFAVLRWASLHMGIRTDDGRPARQRSFSVASDHHIVRQHLVPGGRWLLNILSNAQVNYYDLEEEEPTGRTLIPAQIKVGGKIVISTDHDSIISPAVLQFNLALCIIGESLPGHHRKGLFYSGAQIWSLSVILKKDCLVGLSASQTTHFLLGLWLDKVSLSLLGDDLAICFQQRGSSAAAIIVDWKNIQKGSDDYDRQVIYPINCMGMQLLPHKRALTLGYNSVIVYDYRNVQRTRSMTLPENKELLAPKLWELEIPSNLRRVCEISRPFFLDDGVKCVLFFETHALGIKITEAFPDDTSGSTHPCISVNSKRIGPEYTYKRLKELRFIGYGVTIRDRSLTIIFDTHPWSEAELSGGPLSSMHKAVESLEKKPDGLSSGSFTAFDEVSGRLIIFTYDGKISILDFALIYK